MATCAKQSTAGSGRELTRRGFVHGLPLRILLIEDSAVTAKVVQAYLAGISPDSTVRWAASLSDARSMMEGEPFDLVITDLNLPDSKGLATLEAVLSWTERLVVVLTSEEEQELESAAIERGVYDFVQKSRLSRESLGHVVRLATIQADTLRSLTRTAAERDVQVQRVDFLSRHDRLTGLADRGQFLERVGAALSRASASGAKLAIGMLDIERFRSLNAALGQPAADGVLREVAGRLARAAGVPAVARVGIDQFAILLEPVRGVSEAERVARRMLREVGAEPYADERGAVELSARMGLSRFPSDAGDGATLLARAEDALRKAKAEGETLTFYASDMTRWTAETVTLEMRLRRALREDQFELHYQPKFDARTGSIVGLEGLLRWRAPGEGLVAPGRFIPLMEETGLILQAGEWALRRAVADHGRWSLLGLEVPRVAVNVSALQLRRPDFVARVGAVLRESRLAGAPAPEIDLEITETSAMRDIEANVAKLRELRALGIDVAIDDFGTGYSSLAYLARLPVQQLKIDRTFVKAMIEDPATLVVVRTVIGLARALGVATVAEGVEGETQARLLRELGCDEMQGFLFARPEDFSAIARRLEFDDPRR